MRKTRPNRRWVAPTLAGAALVALAIPLSMTGASAGMSGGGFQVSAYDDSDATISSSAGMKLPSGGSTGEPEVPEAPLEISKSITVNYSAKIGFPEFRYAEIWLVHGLTGAEEKLPGLKMGSFSGSTVIKDAPADSTGWTVQARRMDTNVVIAESTIAPKDLESFEVDGSTNQRVTVAMATKPMTIEIRSSIYTELDRTDPGNVVSEPYSYRITNDRTGATLLQGSGVTSDVGGKIDIIAEDTIPGDVVATIGAEQTGSVDILTITFSYRGEDYSVKTKGKLFLIAESAPLKLIVKPNNDGYMLSQTYPGVTAKEQ